MKSRLPFPPKAAEGSGSARVAWLVGIFVAELVLLAVAYSFFAQIECYLLAEKVVCEALKSLVARAIVMLAVVGVLMTAYPVARGRFLEGAQKSNAVWAIVHCAGLGLLFLPLLRVGSGDLGAGFSAALGPWVAGGAAAAFGGMFWLAAPRVWARLARDLGPLALGALAVSAALPDLVVAIQPIWDWTFLTRLTFDAVAVFLAVFTTPGVVDAAGYVIGVREFAVHISRYCSGVEGFALVTAFIAIYALIFRDTLRMGRFVLLVLPIALVLSWLLNVVRIGTLILVGAYLSPTVAVNGFHSYAGWLFFTLLAMGLVAVVQDSAWLHRGRTVRRREPLQHDPVAVAIMPFILFMLVSTIVSALAPHPEVGYPVNALALLVTVLAFSSGYRRLNWRFDPLAWGAGLAVGVFWVALAAPGDGELAAMLAAMTPGSYASWLVLRLLGTVLLVPLIEEMFFRGYVFARLDRPAGGFGWQRIFAILVSSAGFAALHGRWIEAGLAGIVFALLAVRRGQVTSAIQAHVAANGFIAMVAVWSDDFTLL